MATEAPKVALRLLSTFGARGTDRIDAVIQEEPSESSFESIQRVHRQGGMSSPAALTAFTTARRLKRTVSIRVINPCRVLRSRKTLTGPVGADLCGGGRESCKIRIGGPRLRWCPASESVRTVFGTEACCKLTICTVARGAAAEVVSTCD